MTNIKLLTGTTAQISQYVGAPGVLTVDTDLNMIFVHDGATAGGSPAYGLAPATIQALIEGLAIADISGLQTALDGKIEPDVLGLANGGVAVLDENGFIPEASLPLYLNDVIEVQEYNALPTTGETGTVYVTANDSAMYRWTGSTYFRIMPSVPSSDLLAEGSTNLYYTDDRVRDALTVEGSLSYDPETGVISYTEPTGLTATDFGLGNVPNYQVATLQDELDGTSNILFSTPQGIRGVIEAAGLYEDQGQWYLDEGEMGFQDDMAALTGMSTSFEGELPLYSPTLLTGTTAENDELTLDAGMLSVDTDKNALRLHDGTTQGGFEFILEE